MRKYKCIQNESRSILYLSLYGYKLCLTRPIEWLAGLLVVGLW